MNGLRAPTSTSRTVFERMTRIGPIAPSFSFVVCVCVFALCFRAYDYTNLPNFRPRPNSFAHARLGPQQAQAREEETNAGPKARNQRMHWGSCFFLGLRGRGRIVCVFVLGGRIVSNNQLRTKPMHTGCSQRMGEPLRLFHGLTQCCSLYPFICLRNKRKTGG